MAMDGSKIIHVVYHEDVQSEAQMKKRRSKFLVSSFLIKDSLLCVITTNIKIIWIFI